MNILIVHPSFPGQYFYLCQYLAANPENKVVFLAKDNSIGTMLNNVDLALYKKPVEVDKEHTHPYLFSATEAVLEGQQTLRALESLQKKGFTPDVIIGHAGWGSLMYIKDVYPDTPVMGYFEWYYHALKSDSYYWPEEIPSTDTKLSIRTKNMHHLLSLEACDMGITPTKWQYDQFPNKYKPMLHIQHEGIDTNFCQPAEGIKPACELKTANFSLPAGTEIISYVSRGFEAMRGFPQFMDAIRIVLQHRPKCHVVIAGSDKICYGAQLKDTTYKAMEEEKGGYDKERVHFVGNLNRGDYRSLLQSSSCHIYLTRPFVLSWSMLEAMSFGLPMVTSATPPCMEVVEDGVNGLLAEFRSPKHIARRVEEILEDKDMAAKLGRKARETILDRFELNKALHNYEDLMYSLVR